LRDDGLSSTLRSLAQVIQFRVEVRMVANRKLSGFDGGISIETASVYGSLKRLLGVMLRDEAPIVIQSEISLPSETVKDRD
jgi:hypothetical protein